MVNHNIKNIEELINNPEKINEQDLSYFFELTLKYPSSNFCFLILTKILHCQNRIGFEKSLNSTSLRFGDRKILYDIIHNQKKIQIEKTPSKKIIEFDNDINELEKNIYGNLIQNQLIDEVVLNTSPLKSEDIKNHNLNQFMAFEEWLTIGENINTSNTNIDFIIKNLNERKITKEKNNFYSGSKAAKESLKDTNELNTETLAEIFVKQGNYPKAITIYEQLMLSNPEKKLFFASRINYINQKTQL